MSKSKNTEEKSTDCFVIMPIADPDGYKNGHFLRVFEDIIKPACKNAGFNAIRSDEVKQTNLIHLDILQKLIDSPMAICDLSSRNPNVLFELGLRQAFDKPTVLVQETGTPKIFDISPLRYTEYRRDLGYREVLEDQNSISLALEATASASTDGEGVNSIIKLLALSTPAKLPDKNNLDQNGLLQLVRAEINDLRSDFRQLSRRADLASRNEARNSKASIHARKLGHQIDQIIERLEYGIPAYMAASEVNDIQQQIFERISENNNSSDQVFYVDLLEKSANAERIIAKKLAIEQGN